MLLGTLLHKTRLVLAAPIKAWGHSSHTSHPKGVSSRWWRLPIMCMSSCDMRICGLSLPKKACGLQPLQVKSWPKRQLCCCCCCSRDVA